LKRNQGHVFLFCDLAFLTAYSRADTGEDRKGLVNKLFRVARFCLLEVPAALMGVVGLKRCPIDEQVVLAVRMLAIRFSCETGLLYKGGWP